MPINSTVKLCGARARQRGYLPCRQPAMKNGRCRLHGGKSTGAKTKQGKVAAAKANYKHGLYSQEAQEDTKIMQIMMSWRNNSD